MKIYLACEQEGYEGIVKILGFFSTPELAQKAIQNYIEQNVASLVKVEDCKIEEVYLNEEKS